MKKETIDDNFNWFMRPVLIAIFGYGLITLIINGLSSCTNETANGRTSHNYEPVKIDTIYNIKDNFGRAVILEIEGCEYLILNHNSIGRGSQIGMHKGNCKSPIHCYNK